MPVSRWHECLRIEPATPPNE